MTISQLVLAGDSIPQGTGPAGTASTYGQGGHGSWWELVRDRLANIKGLGPRLSVGLRGTWLGIVGSNKTEWTFNGSWSTTASTDAWDKAPYGGSAIGGSQYGSGSDKSAIWTKQAWMPPVVGFHVDWIDYTNGGNWSYRIDGGAWTANGQTIAHGNAYKRFYVASAVASTVEIRCADTGGTAAGCCPVGIEPFEIAPQGASGFILHDIAINGSQLHELVATTSGDRMAFFDSVVLGTGSPIAPTPNVGVINCNINDVTLASTSGWNTDLGKLNTRVGPLGPVGFISDWEANTASYNQTQQTNYRAQTKTTAAAFGTPAKVLDLYDAWAALGFTANAGAVAAGFLAADGIHQSSAGNIDIAARVYWWLRNNFLSSYSSAPSTYTAIGKQAAVAYTGKRATVAYAAAVPIAVVPV